MKHLKYIFKESIKFFIILILLANIISYYKSLNLNKNNLPFVQTQLINSSPYIPPSDQAILVHFWATWCPICTLEAANINAIANDYEVITIAVNSDTDTKIKEFLEKNNLNFNVINDQNSTLAKKMNITVYPTTLIYDKNKNLVFSEVGYTSTLGLYLRMIWANL